MAYGYRPWEVNLDEVEAKDDVKVRIRKFPQDHDREPTMAALPVNVYGHAPPHPDHTDPKTVLAGGFKRFMRRTPDPDPKLLGDLKDFVRKEIERNPLWTPLDSTSDTSFETWVSSTSYPEWRREDLRQTWKQYDGHLRPWHTVCSSFMKDETYGGCEYKHARCIMSTHDVFKCEVGPIFRLIEKKVFKDPSFIKYVPVPDRPQTILEKLWQPGAKYIATDYTAYESHFVASLMEAVEFVLYEHMTKHLRDGPRFMHLMRTVLAGRRRASFKYFDVEVEATRMSGEMNTSLGNGFANLMLFKFACHLMGAECDGVVEGDDGLFRVRGEVPQTELFEKLGFTIKSVQHNKLETASFCGMVFDLHDRVNVTDVRDILVTFGWSGTRHVKFNHTRQLELLRCKSLSYAHQYPGCPIIQSLAEYGLRVTRKIRIDRVINKSRWMNQWDRDQLLQAVEYFKENEYVRRPVPQNTRKLVSDLYGIPEWVQVDIEKYLDSLSTLEELHHWSFDIVLPQSSRHYFQTYVRDTITEAVVDLCHLPKYDGRLAKYSKNLVNWDGH